MPETNVKISLNKFIDKLQQVQIAYLKTLGLIMPQTEDPAELFLWKGLYSVLAEAHYKELISTENIFKFAQIFSTLDKEAQHNYLAVLEDKFVESDIKYKNTLLITSKLLYQNKVENLRDQIPKAVRPVFDYVVYSTLAGLEIDENLINEAIHELSPEGQAELAAANIFQTIEKTKRKPLNAGRIDGQTQYNKVFTKEQLAKVLEENEQPSQPTNSSQPKPPASTPIAEPKIMTPGIRTLPKKQPAPSTYTNSPQNFAPRPIQQPVQNYPRQNFTPAQQAPNQNYSQQVRRSPLPRTVMNTRLAPRTMRATTLPQSKPLQSMPQTSRTQPQIPNQTTGFSKTVHGLDDLLK